MQAASRQCQGMYNYPRQRRHVRWPRDGTPKHGEVRQFLPDSNDLEQHADEEIETMANHEGTLDVTRWSRSPFTIVDPCIYAHVAAKA